MMSKKTLARVSGFTYLILILTGVFGLVYVPSAIIVWSSPDITVANIKSSEFLFRLGILSQIICFIAFIMLPLFLYELLKSVGKTAATLMVVFALISIPITFVNILNKINVLLLLSGVEYLNKIPQEQLHAQVMYLLASFNNGNMVSNIFWGAWLFPLGYLVFKSHFLPKILGIFLMIGCFGYLVEFLARFLFSLTEIPWYVSMPSSIGEFGICLWLLVFGINEKKFMNNDFSSRSTPAI
ncbi:MAG: DUF4386 domain-containing protein [Pseudomonadota bacterium]